MSGGSLHEGKDPEFIFSYGLCYVWWSDPQAGNDTIYSNHPVTVSSPQLWMVFAPTELAILQVINKSNDSRVSSFLNSKGCCHLLNYLQPY